MTKKYQIVYTACIYEEKKFRYSDGSLGSGVSWLSPYDLWPNKVKSQVFDIENFTCPSIVQIGSNDGSAGEHYGFLPFLESLNNFKLFLIEPQAKYINFLRDIYGKFGNKVVYVNAAITEYSGKFNMTDRENSAQIVSEKTNSFHDDGGGKLLVDGISWEDFLKTSDINEIDILLMDCEGYEFNIIKQFENSKIFPKRIRYEYPHFNNSDEVDFYLKEKGYSIEYCITDPCWDKVAILGGEPVEYNISPQWKIPKNIL